MTEKTIKKDELIKLLADLSGDCQVFAPTLQNDSLVIEQINSAEEIALNASNTKKSVKGVLFPQRERLLSYDLLKPEEMTEPPFPDKQRVVFGIRPCDAKSLLVFDHVFNSKEYPDPYYLNKRDNTLVISIGCNAPAGTCFCTATGGGPFSTDGSDILLYETKDAYIAQGLTEKGAAFLDDNTAFIDADDSCAQVKEEMAAASNEAIKSNLQTQSIKEKLDKGFHDDVWDTLHEKCIGCGTCTYLCPTCHCFDIVDETTGETGERLRIWDSCMYPNFTLHASGGNPRSSGKQRMRQRVMHKFKYFVDNNDMIACTGCGRCIKHCPVNLDIREVLDKIEKS